MMMDCLKLIERYCPADDPLHEVLVGHSRQVAALADEVCARLKRRGVPVDSEFVHEAAMLHDIGIVKVDAPDIHCHGTEPYICHGVIGREMLDELGLHRHALVCERHTGAGITVQDIEQQHLPLPHRDLLPVSLEEQIVCYADKFFSKTHVGAPARTLEEARAKLAKFGVYALARFDAMEALLGH